jgi:hypothetical protein
MTDRVVRLELDEWQRVLAVLAQAPWSTANPLIMKIGEQLRMQEPMPPAQTSRGNGVDAEAASQGGRSE